MTNMDLFRELGGIDPDLILKAAPEETVSRAVRQPSQKRWIAWAASLLVIFGAATFVGFDNVSAAVRQIFSFIPGVGIQEGNTGTVYVCEPAVSKSSCGGVTAKLLRVSYSDGRLCATVHIGGTAVFYEDIRLYINGQRKTGEPPQGPDFFLHVSEDASMVDVDFQMDTPTQTDYFEIEIDGLPERLAFTMRPCETFEELQQIGPTVTKNGISLTVTAQREENQLVVWCYETRQEGATPDAIVGYGSPVNSSNSLLRYLETDRGSIYENTEGWHIGGRMEYDLEAEDGTAVLHIPYLAMSRPERLRLDLTIPKVYGISEANVAAEASLGVIRVVSVERRVYEHNPDKDAVRIRLAYENDNNDLRMYSFAYRIAGNYPNAVLTNSAQGTVDCIEAVVDRDTWQLDITIDGIYYYQMGEYVFELNIPE